MAWSSGYQLRVVEGKHKGMVIVLDQPSLTLGRATTPGESSPGYVFFYEPTVSRVHAELRWNEKKKHYALHHKSNTNPTLVNGTPVDKRSARPLEPGSSIQMGLLVIEMETAGVGAPTPPTSPREELSGLLGGSVRGPASPPTPLPPAPAPSNASVVGPILEALNSISETARKGAQLNRRPEEPSPVGSTEPESGSFLERGFERDVSAAYRLVVAEGPDRGLTLPIKDTVMVLGRSEGLEDPRQGQGILLSDPSLPTEAAMLVWQARENTYGLHANESSPVPLRVRRVVSGTPREVTVDPKRPIPLQDGDVVLVGDSVLVLRRGEAVATASRPETTRIRAADIPQKPRSSSPTKTGLPPWAEKEPAPEEDPETDIGIVPRGFSNREGGRDTATTPTLVGVARPDLDPSEVPTAVGSTRNPPTTSGPGTPAEELPLDRRVSGADIKLPDTGVLAWPWKNQSDFVFDFLAGPNKGCQVALAQSELPEDRTITLGGAGGRANDILIESPNVPNLAATLRYRSGRFGLLNEGPDDTVMVNRVPLKRGDQVVLMTGDRIDVHDSVFRFLERRVVEILQGFQLQVDSGVDQDQDRIFQFSKQRLLIGRGKGCDIQLNDLEVSRVHVSVVMRDGKFYVQHRSETNPTFLNGVSLLPGAERTISPGDRIRLSSLTLLQFARAEPRRRQTPAR